MNKKVIIIWGIIVIVLLTCIWFKKYNKEVEHDVDNKIINNISDDAELMFYQEHSEFNPGNFDDNLNENTLVENEYLMIEMK